MVKGSCMVLPKKHSSICLGGREKWERGDRSREGERGGGMGEGDWGKGEG